MLIPSNNEMLTIEAIGGILGLCGNRTIVHCLYRHDEGSVPDLECIRYTTQACRSTACGPQTASQRFYIGSRPRHQRRVRSCRPCGLMGLALAPVSINESHIDYQNTTQANPLRREHLFRSARVGPARQNKQAWPHRLKRLVADCSHRNE